MKLEMCKSNTLLTEFIELKSANIICKVHYNFVIRVVKYSYGVRMQYFTSLSILWMQNVCAIL